MVEGVEPRFAYPLPAGKGFLVVTKGKEAPIALYTVGSEGGKPRRIPSDDVQAEGCCVVSPDGDMTAYVSKEGRLKIVPLSGSGDSRFVPNLPADGKDSPIRWSADGRFLYMTRLGELPARVQRVDLTTGRKEVWKDLSPADPSGVVIVNTVAMSPDGRSYAYSYQRVVASDLYVLNGLK
jgi:dipeptidyl aminopeptidase/acylaminoacyl peptidase